MTRVVHWLDNPRSACCLWCASPHPCPPHSEQSEIRHNQRRQRMSQPDSRRFAAVVDRSSRLTTSAMDLSPARTHLRSASAQRSGAPMSTRLSTCFGALRSSRRVISESYRIQSGAYALRPSFTADQCVSRVLVGRGWRNKGVNLKGRGKGQAPVRLQHLIRSQQPHRPPNDSNLRQTVNIEPRARDTV